jgi:hypothetical protein
VPGRHWPKDNRWGLEPHWQELSRPWLARRPHTCGGSMWKWHSLGHDRQFVRATSVHPNALQVAEALLGGPLRHPSRNRGIYFCFPAVEPSPAQPPPSLGPHTDSPLDVTLSDLMMVVNLGPVGQRSGGFTIWPGSPQLLYPLYDEEVAEWPQTERGRAGHERVRREIRPHEFVGDIGDALFCHVSASSTHAAPTPHFHKFPSAPAADQPGSCRSSGRRG